MFDDEWSEDEWLAFAASNRPPPCVHRDSAITFPDGTTAYGSSAFDRYTEIKPDFGLYLDKIWNPITRAEFVLWSDFGLPARWDIAALAIVNAFKLARAGAWVEVGCLGGHGRTGTVLACMGILSGLSPQESLIYVRSNYCTLAVEGQDQEWWLEWFHTFLYGGIAENTPRGVPPVHYDGVYNWEKLDDLTPEMFSGYTTEDEDEPRN